MSCQVGAVQKRYSDKTLAYAVDMIRSGTNVLVQGIQGIPDCQEFTKLQSE